jgi:chromosome segregation ATPase
MTQRKASGGVDVDAESFEWHLAYALRLWQQLRQRAEAAERERDELETLLERSREATANQLARVRELEAEADEDATAHLELVQKLAKLLEAAKVAMKELGVPGTGYPANVGHAYDRLRAAVADVEGE